MPRTNLDVEGANCLPSVSLVVGFFFLFSFFFFWIKAATFPQTIFKVMRQLKLLFVLLSLLSVPYKGFDLPATVAEASEVQRTPTTVR